MAFSDIEKFPTSFEYTFCIKAVRGDTDFVCNLLTACYMNKEYLKILNSILFVFNWIYTFLTHLSDLSSKLCPLEFWCLWWCSNWLISPCHFIKWLWYTKGEILFYIFRIAMVKLLFIRQLKLGAWSVLLYSLPVMPE